MPNHKLIDIAPIYNGKKIPYSVWTHPTELILRTQYGNIRICYAEKDLMLIKGENGLGIRIDKEMIRHEDVEAGIFIPASETKGNRPRIAETG